MRTSRFLSDNSSACTVLATNHKSESVGRAETVATPRGVDLRLVNWRLARDLIAREVGDRAVCDADRYSIVFTRTAVVQILTLRYTDTAVNTADHRFTSTLPHVIFSHRT